MDHISSAFEIDRKEIMGNDFLVASRVEDYNMDWNKLLIFDEHKSYPRELYCVECASMVVMSNKAFGAYELAPDPAKILCGKCFGDKHMDQGFVMILLRKMSNMWRHFIKK